MLESYFLKGLLIGIVFGVPAGVVGVLSIQRGMSQGPAAGFITGMGSSVADLFYAGVGVFGITVISDFLLKHQHIICMAGCLLVIAIGIQGLKKAGNRTADVDSTEQGGAEAVHLPSCFFTSFMIAITNPATILSFMVVFSMFQIQGTEPFGTSIRLLLGIFLGTCFWWLLIALVTGRFRSRVTKRFYVRLNQVFGILMVFLGLAIGSRMFIV